MGKMERSRIENLLGKINDDDRQALVGLLCKAGYSVRIGKERIGSKGQTRYFVEYWKEADDVQMEG